MKSQRISSPWEVYSLINERELIPGKSYLKSGGKLFRLMKIVLNNMRLQVHLESESKENLSLTHTEFRKLNFEIVVSKGITREDWVDPA